MSRTAKRPSTLCIESEIRNKKSIVDIIEVLRTKRQVKEQCEHNLICIQVILNKRVDLY